MAFIDNTLAAKRLTGSNIVVFVFFSMILALAEILRFCFIVNSFMTSKKVFAAVILVDFVPINFTEIMFVSETKILDWSISFTSDTFRILKTGYFFYSDISCDLMYQCNTLMVVNSIIMTKY